MSFRAGIPKVWYASCCSGQRAGSTVVYSVSIGKYLIGESRVESNKEINSTGRACVVSPLRHGNGADTFQFSSTFVPPPVAAALRSASITAAALGGPSLRFTLKVPYYAPFPQIKIDPRCVKDMSVTCFGQNCLWIKYCRSLFIG